MEPEKITLFISDDELYPYYQIELNKENLRLTPDHEITVTSEEYESIKKAYDAFHTARCLIQDRCE